MKGTRVESGQTAVFTLSTKRDTRVVWVNKSVSLSSWNSAPSTKRVSELMDGRFGTQAGQLVFLSHLSSAHEFIVGATISFELSKKTREKIFSPPRPLIKSCWYDIFRCKQSEKAEPSKQTASVVGYIVNPMNSQGTLQANSLFFQTLLGGPSKLEGNHFITEKTMWPRREQPRLVRNKSDARWK